MKSLLGLLSLVLIVCQISFGYVLNSDNKGEKSFKINLFEYTFDNSVLVQPNDEFSYTGSPYLSLPNSYNYKPDPNNAETITLTDFTSITQPTSNGESCIVPFLSNGISNFFCVDKQDATNSYECETVSGFGDCNLGKFMQVKRAATGDYFTALVNFKAPFMLYATASYELALNYLLNVDTCERNDYSLKVIIYNQDLNQVIFSLEDAQDDDNDKWNEARIEFRVDQTGQVFLLIQVEGYCATVVNDAFIAIDNIELNQLSEPQESTITTTSTVPSTTTTMVPITTTTTIPTTTTITVTIASSSSRLPTLPSSLSSILPSSISPIRSTSTQATEASTEQPIETEEPITTTTSTTTTSTTATTTSTTTTSTTTTTTTQTTVRTTQTTVPTTEAPKGDDVLLIVLLSTLIPITVIAVGGGVFFYFYKKKSSKTSDSSALEMDAPIKKHLKMRKC